MRLAAALACGLVMALGQPPWNLWPLAFAGLAGALLLCRDAPRGRGFWTGWAVGLGYFGLSLGWIVEPFQVDAAVTGWMAPFALIGMAAGMALFWGLPAWLASRSRDGRRMLALVALWGAAEVLRAFAFTGFPWGLVGYLWAPTAAVQWASVTGPYGLTLATLAAAGAMASTLRPGARGRVVKGIAAGLGLAVLIGGGWALTPPLQDLSDRPVVRLVQPNAPQHEKWDQAMIPTFFRRQVEFTGATPQSHVNERPALVVWPETALPMLLDNAGEALAIATEAAAPGNLAVGVQRLEGRAYYNSMALVAPGPEVRQVYDKHHLVPFGEYMPFPELFLRINISGLAARAAGGYAAGPGPELVDFGPRVGMGLPLICYEAVFPRDTRAEERPDFLLQITNDAWFGRFSGPYQHLMQARMRAIEQGLPLLRAANTGVSAVIDGAGRVLKALPLGQAGYLDTALPEPLRPTIYARTGDLPVFAALFLLVLMAFVPSRRECD
ncbi:apolipoprotein N-acyltransferase [Salipiger mucosus]|uniref:Apolipoprotein N-acyltransferase n=1 Tax=Salipiger mucosus DSM 16094 TaxID=1123237 RepID=S9RNN2_9RHOB|nr:apolipoprotein N-acyltransferase [Salipiger mucosus]EPX79680.1 Apolipoprotein N-acyltransferase / Copper homeostasis protein CutE [Salipiger mucosus DSM 16094]